MVYGCLNNEITLSMVHVLHRFFIQVHIFKEREGGNLLDFEFMLVLWVSPSYYPPEVGLSMKSLADSSLEVLESINFMTDSRKSVEARVFSK